MPIETKNGTMYTLQEAADYLGHPVVTLRTYIQRKLIAKDKIGSAVVISKKECDRFRKAKRTPGRPAQK